MNPLRTTILILLGTLALTLTPLAAQQYVAKMPEALQEFWNDYASIKAEGEESDIDRHMRKNTALGERLLVYLVAEYCSAPTPDYSLEGEMRTVAWSLDRVGGQERFIERVRLVTGLEFNERRERLRALFRYDEGLELLKEARFEKDPERLKLADTAFKEAAAVLERLGDAEFTCFALQKSAEVARIEERLDDLEVVLNKIIELGEPLPYEFLVVDSAHALLRDIAKVRSGEGTEVRSALEEKQASGRGLDSYAEGSKERIFPVTYVVPKKGMPDVLLPSFAPLEQDFIWLSSFMDGNGPTEFDAWREGILKPFGKPLLISRDGVEYGFDADHDGEPDVVDSLSSTPKTFVIPNPDGGHPYALRVSVGGDTEVQFGTSLNLAPSQEFASVRFNVGGYLEADVDGEAWRFYDTNLSGGMDNGWMGYGDWITALGDDERQAFYEVDGVQIGKSDKALPWSSVIAREDGFYRSYVNESGTELSLRAMYLEQGQVQLEMDTAVVPSYLVIREVGELAGAFFDVVPAKKRGAVTVPAGTYEVVFGRLESGKKTDMKVARIYKGRSEPFTVEAGATYTLELGAPYDIDFDMFNEGEETVVDTRSIRTFGRGGEEYAMLFNEPLQAQLDVRTAAGKKIEKNKKLRAAGYEEWDLAQDESSGQRNVLWFPVRHRVPNTKGEPLQARLHLKKHKLLGGPFDSGWQPETE